MVLEQSLWGPEYVQGREQLCWSPPVGAVSMQWMISSIVPLHAPKLEKQCYGTNEARSAVTASIFGGDVSLQCSADDPGRPCRGPVPIR